MPELREVLCFELARRMMKPPTDHTASYDAYSDWRQSELESQWSDFDDRDITDKDVLDFGCGFGNLTFHLAAKGPKSIVGVELEPLAFEQAEKLRARASGPYVDRVRFAWGEVDRIPFPDQSFDTIVAFDCVEHLSDPQQIANEWRRVLRPGGKVLIWWSPYRGPWGPHMEAIIPIPWAHVLFGERAMLRTAERIYDLDSFIPRPWHFAENGERKPNQFRAIESFAQQGYINQLTLSGFRDVVTKAGLEVSRLEPHGFGGSLPRRTLGRALVNMPVLGEWMTSFYVVECVRPT